MIPNQLVGGVSLYLLSNLFRADDNLIGFEFLSFSDYNKVTIEIKSVDLPGKLFFVDFQNTRTYYAFNINVAKGFNKFLLPNPCKVLKNWFIAIINPPRIFYVDSTLTSDYFDYYFENHGGNLQNHFHSCSGRVLFNPILQQKYYVTYLKLKYLFWDSGSYFYNLISLNNSKIIESTTLKINSCKIL